MYTTGDNIDQHKTNDNPKNIQWKSRYIFDVSIFAACEDAFLFLTEVCQ